MKGSTQRRGRGYPDLDPRKIAKFIIETRFCVVALSNIGNFSLGSAKGILVYTYRSPECVRSGRHVAISGDVLLGNGCIVVDVAAVESRIDQRTNGAQAGW